MQHFKMYLNHDCDEILTDLERSNFEYMMHRYVIAWCINHTDEISKDHLDYWYAEYQKCAEEYGIMRLIFADVILSAFDGRSIEWEHPLDTRDLYITVHDDDPVDNFDDMERYRPVQPTRPEQFGDMIDRFYNNNSDSDDYKTVTKTCARSLTFQVTDSCNLCCSYCYQINKGKRRMTFETAKKIVDLVLSDNGLKGYVGDSKIAGMVIDFIGGEPLLEIELIDQICTYMYTQMIILHHPLTTRFRFSICSNGVLYFSNEFQRFLDKWKDLVSLAITVDGNKELHDKCRLFPDGSPSYDIAMNAVNDYLARGYRMGSKITVSPDNVSVLSDAVINMFATDYSYVHANCVFEEGWTYEHARIEYEQLKIIADYMIDNNIAEAVYFSMFNADQYHVLGLHEAEGNWCGGTGTMLAFDPDGEAYPCIRYMASSLGKDQPAIPVGAVDRGLVTTENEKKYVEFLNSITRITQSSDECINCPIADGCSWCSGYNYQVFGTPNKRATFICVMHQAESLANVYFWNKVYRLTEKKERFSRNCPDEWALNIVSKEELNMLDDLAKED